MAILNHLHKIDEVDCLRTRSYIVVTVERKAIDHLRQSKHEVAACDEQLYVNSLHIPSSGDIGLVNVLAELSLEYQQVIVWRYLHGYSVREIAGMLGKFYAAVDKMLWRGKKELEKQLRNLRVIRWESYDEEKKG